MRTTIRNSKGFTLAELLVALMISAIILSSVASLSHAMSSVSSGNDEIIAKQSRLRIAMLRLKELIKNAKMICNITSTELVVWKSDIDKDNKIDSDELVYVDTGSQHNMIKIIEFNNIAGMSIKLSEIRSGSAKNFLVHSALKGETILIQGCSNVNFTFDVTPPGSRFVVVKFECKGPDSIEKYQIEATVITDSEALIDSSNELFTNDDD